MKSNVPKISIIIPVYNAEQYLRFCLDSVLGQTLTEIEVICVNDGSTDSSKTILDEYAGKDSRVIVFHKEKNAGTLLARKMGMLQATGEYSTFIDPDDYYATKYSLDIVYNQIVEQGVDILQFSMVPVGKYSEADKLFIEKFLFCQEAFWDDNILEAVCNWRYSWILTNKIFRTRNCIKAAKHIKNEYLLMSEDFYIYFLIAAYSHSFRGVTDTAIYCYRQGVGISTSGISLSRFQHYIKAVSIVEWLNDFIDSESKPIIYKKYIGNIEGKLLETLATNFLRLSATQKADALNLLRKELNRDIWVKFVGFVFSVGKLLPREFSQVLFCKNNTMQRPIKVIGIYTIPNCDEVLFSRLTQILQCLGYTIRYFFSDNKENHLEHLFNFINENAIDCMLTKGIYSITLLDDIKLFKLLGIHYLIVDYSQLDSECEYTIYSTADAVLVGSRERQYYYRLMGIHSEYFPLLAETKCGYSSKAMKRDCGLCFKLLSKKQENNKLHNEDNAEFLKRILLGVDMLGQEKLVLLTHESARQLFKKSDENLTRLRDLKKYFECIRSFSMRSYFKYRILSLIALGSSRAKYKKFFEEQSRIYQLIRKGYRKES